MSTPALTSAVFTVTLCLSVISLPAASGGLPVIPGASGFGMETPAGSGRHLAKPQTTVYKVTNLNDAGPGSLREALTAEGPRVVVFEVSGNIEMVGAVGIKHPYLTVAGQTAPSPGITLKRCELVVSASDVLLQHIRVRVGDLVDPKQPLRNEKSGWTQWSERDTMKVVGDRVVIDHCSFSWAPDENVQSTGRDVTFRHNIFSEGLNSQKHHKGAHSKGLLIRCQTDTGARNVAIVGNLFVHNHGRNPRMAGGSQAVINNLIYNARMGIELDAIRYPLYTTVIGNHFIAGAYGRRWPGEESARTIWFLPRNEHTGRVFMADHRVDGDPVPDPWNSPHTQIFTEWMGKPVDPSRFRTDEPPVVVPGLEIKPSKEVYEWVLANAGARPADRDPVDTRIVRDVRQRTGDIPASQDDVGGWAKLANNRRPLSLPNNPNGDDDGDGYTNFEEWLHGFATAVEVP
jgi:hypothetical protein